MTFHGEELQELAEARAAADAAESAQQVGNPSAGKRGAGTSAR